MLEIDDIHAGYESQEVLHGLSFSVKPGSIVSIVGANGAGKTTTLRVVSGLMRPTAGTVTVDGNRLSGRSGEESVRAGLAHVPEGRQLFNDMTVRDNLMLGAYTTRRGGESVTQRLEEVLALFPAVEQALNKYAGSLSGGQQQMVAIGRGLMSGPQYLLLDEPSVGLAPQVVERIFQAIEQLRDQGKGILLVEQNGRLALGVSDHAFLLEGGSTTLSGTGPEMLANTEVIERYLGVGASTGSQKRRGEFTRRLGWAMSAES